MNRTKTIWMCIAFFIAFASPGAVAAGGGDDPKLLFEHGCYRKAKVVCEQRLAANPKDAQAGAILARITANLGDYSKAVDLAVAAAAADPKNADVQYTLSECYGRKAQHSSVLNQPGLAGKMRKAADACLAIDPNHVDALDILMDFHRFAPGIMGGDKKKVKEFGDRLLKVDAAEGWLKQAEIASEDKDTVRLAECYRKAAAVQPPNGRAQVSLASWLAPRYRDPATSEKLALAAVAAEPWRTGGWQVLASLYAFQGRYDELESVLQKSEAAEPTHLAPYYNAAVQLVTNDKDPQRAERYLRHYLTREPEIGRFSHAAARWRLGQALEKQGKKAEATAEIAAAVKADPKLEDAKKDLKRLKG